MPNYTLKHLLLIIALILICGYVLLWLFHFSYLTPFPNSEIYILLMMYIIMLGVTAYGISSVQLSLIHRRLGFNKITLRFVVLALAAAIAVWLIDFAFQVKILQTDTVAEAQEWFNKNKAYSWAAVFLSTVIFAPIIEEMLLRGVFFQVLKSYIAPIRAAIVLSAIFSLLHFSLDLALTLFIASLAYFYLTMKSKSIVPAILAHMVNNLLTFIYYMCQQ